MKRKVLTTVIAVALTMQSVAIAEATHKHTWVDDIKNSSDTINRYTCECGESKDEIIADIRNYIITFDANGGYVAEPEKETYKGRIKWLPIPVRTSDYQWEGWFTEPDGGELVNDKRIYEEDTTLYAQWTLKGTRTLTFASDGGSYIWPVTRKLGETISLDEYIPKRDGYIFKGWYSDPRKKENEVTEFTLNENGVVYARWEEEKLIEPKDAPVFTDEEYEKRVQRIRSLIQQLMERYFDVLQRAD